MAKSWPWLYHNHFDVDILKKRHKIRSPWILHPQFVVRLSLGHDVQKWKGVKCYEQDMQQYVFAEEKGELIFFLPLPVLLNTIFPTQRMDFLFI